VRGVGLAHADGSSQRRHRHSRAHCASSSGVIGRHAWSACVLRAPFGATARANGRRGSAVATGFWFGHRQLLRPAVPFSRPA
jgi:hypothetical protein